MIFNHLESAELNFKKGFKNIQLFEIGPIYNSPQSQENILSIHRSNSSCLLRKKHNVYIRLYNGVRNKLG